MTAGSFRSFCDNWRPLTATSPDSACDKIKYANGVHLSVICKNTVLVKCITRVRREPY